MKKVTVIIAVLAIILEFLQCRKPDFSMYNGNLGQKQTIEFTVDYNGGEKGNFDPLTAGGVLKYKWDIDNSDGKIDYMLVYVHDGTAEEITDETKFTSGTYLGAIPIVSVSPGGYSAKFKGYLKNVPAKGVIRFVHLGQGITADNSGKASVDFSTQNGFLDQLSKRIVAIYDKPYTKIEPFINGLLDIQYAIAYFNFSDYGSGDVNIFNNLGTVLNLNTDGTFNYSGSTTMTLQNAGSQSGTFFAIMPSSVSSKDSSPRKFTFYANHKLRDLTIRINKNSFYGTQGSDQPFQITPDVTGIFPDLFSVSDTKKVRFSTGNLWYLGKTSTWRFADNQWDVLGIGPSGTFSPSDENQYGNVTLAGYALGEYNSTDYNANYARDLFGWATTGYPDERTKSTGYQTNYYPYSTSIGTDNSIPTNPTRYGPDFDGNKYGLTVDSHSDWGYVLGPEKGWYTPTLDEFLYLLNSRTAEKGNASKINGIDARYAMVTVNGVHGIMVFPDVFTWPTDVSASAPTVLNQLSGDWNGGVNYVGADFTKLENLGVVFFNTAGQREGPVHLVGTFGLFWTSTCGTIANRAYSFAFCNGVVNINNDVDRVNGRCVRLARAAE